MISETISTLIAAGPWYVWVLEYVEQDAVMRLALHKGEFPEYQEIVCSGVSYFEGFLEGGPYRLTIFEEATPARSETLLVSEKRDLLIRCLRVEQGRSRRISSNTE
jgi:hypothetical protein